ncbi:MAG: glycosyltransferase [Verrucomicrobia bacterium]|nr:glycosyltransferase [Verrucomicrobiota bacterium]
MSDPLPSVTVIIAARPDQAETQAVPSARALDYPPAKLEILIARGKQPSVQRNTALRAARGELIYFLDDDSVAQADNLRRAVAHFRDPKVQIVGGPNLCPADAPALEQVFALVLGSWLAFGPSRARYTPVGALRETSEKELILCNQLARRETMLKYGGFNEALYPNEENALMDDIQKHGGKLLYDPELRVYRRPRRTLSAFAKMLRTYGRGRAEQFRVNPTLGSALNFVPPLFLVYLLALPPLVCLIGRFALIPLALYALVVLLQGLAVVPRGGIVRSAGALPLIVLTHVLYGFGFWRGLFTRLGTRGQKSLTEVTLESIPT